jgi:hypothetical protein
MIDKLMQSGAPTPPIDAKTLGDAANTFTSDVRFWG